MSNKKAIVLVNSDSLDVDSILLVDRNVDSEGILKAVKKVKDEVSEWQLSDIVDSITEDFVEIEYETIYL